MGQYIPDITERFPEGFGGIDMTDRYFPSRRSPYDMWDYLDEIDDIPTPSETEDEKEIEKPLRVFQIGEEYEWVDWFTGGVSFMTVKDIKDNILTFAEYRREIDGEYEKNESFVIMREKNGDEYIKMCEYRGEVGKLYAYEK